MPNKIKCLDHGYVTLLNLAGPTRRPEQDYDAHDFDPANTARISFDGSNQDRTPEDEAKLLRYLYNNQHMTPFEMITGWFEMKMPIFVARQFVRHRTCSINEISGRYVQLDKDFYIPAVKNVGTKSASNKQGRTLTEMDEDEEQTKKSYQFIEDLERHCSSAYTLYEQSIQNGIPNELSRMVLPLNIYTKWVWKMDLRNLMHLMELRLDGHAQYEARQYAQAMFLLLQTQLPELMALFKEQLDGA